MSACEHFFGGGISLGRGELEQIQFLLGHVSVETTERYLGCKQRLRNAVNDRIGLEPSSLNVLRAG
jgi:site-specific recombinase XerD